MSYYYLQSVVNLNENPEVHFKYIQAATSALILVKFEKSSAVAERVTSSKRQNSQTSFPSPLSAIGSTLFMISFSTFTRTVSPSLSTYIFSESRLLQVVSGLLNISYDETTVKGSLASVTGNFPIDELVREVEQRTSLKLILLWLETDIQSRS
jgi:clathrin heavy chain